MEIDLNVPGQLTIDSVAALLGSKDDTQARQLRVTTGGIAYLSDEVGADNIQGLACRFETWDEKGGYVGRKASMDRVWVERIYAALVKNWPDPKSRYIDIF